MTSQYRHRRNSNPASVFVALEPGEIAVNTASRQLTVGDADSGTIGSPIALLGIRIFDARAIYATADCVVQAGSVWRAKASTGPGSFNSAQWDSIAGQVGPFVQRSGDVMTGHLDLPPTNPAATQAVRRDYVEGALAPYAPTIYVDQKSALAVQKAGDRMTGPLVLSGAPTADEQAANKAYVDAGGTPPGAIMDFATPTAPSGWLVCDGQAVGRTAYAALFAAIGTTWGAGDGITTFNVPSFMNRYRRHRQVGGLAGSVGTLQSPANMSHSHPVNIDTGYMSADHTHYISGTTNANDRSLDHLHSGVPSQTGTATSGTNIGTGGATYVNPGDAFSGAMDRVVDHLHTMNFWSGGTSANHYHNVNGNTGGGSADSNESRPYSATVLTCIRY